MSECPYCNGATCTCLLASALEISESRVKELEAEKSKAWDSDLFTRRIIEAHQAGYRMGRESAVTDQSGEGESGGRHLTTDEQDILLQSLWDSVQIVEEPDQRENGTPLMGEAPK